MQKISPGILFTVLLILAITLACNISNPKGNLPSIPATTAIPVIVATSTSTTAPASTPTPSITPPPPPTQTSSVSGNALLSTSGLCWLGPGNAYEVSSSIGAGTRVQLLGQGARNGWWIILNPRFHDPCWIQSEYLQVDPNVDVSALTVYPVPPTPTPSH